MSLGHLLLISAALLVATKEASSYPSPAVNGLSSELNGQFDPNRVHVIDSAFGGRSIIFRGSMPREGDTFAYTELLDTMRKVALAQSGIALPVDNGEIFIQDISLLSYEVSDWDVEKKYFAKNPSQGDFHLYPIVGQFIDPAEVPSELRKYMAEKLSSWQIDNLPKTMAFLRTMLYQPPLANNKTRVIYVHCEAGEDRTGEVSGSYYVRYLNWGFQRALAYDDHIESRLIKSESRNAFDWYCYYLLYTNPSFSDLDCIVPGNETRVV